MRFLLLLLLSFPVLLNSQELYPLSDPASNMPARSFGIRFNNTIMGSNSDAGRDWGSYRFSPEFQWGISKNHMVHVNFYASSLHQKNFKFEGGRLYYKYRFYSRDDSHKHFRMAAFAKVGLSGNPLTWEEITLGSDHTGFEIGWTGTQLVKKFAISFTGSYTKAFNNLNHEMTNGIPSNSLNFSVSNGLLVFPQKYKNYNQTNINIYAEFFGKWNPENNSAYIDIAPSFQFIFNSQVRLDFAYRVQMAGNMERAGNQQFIMKFLYVFFNAY